MDGVEVVEQLIGTNRGRGVDRNARDPVVVLGRVDGPLATASGCVADEGRRVEAGRRTAHLLLQPHALRERGAEVFDHRHQVVHVDVVGVDIDVGEPLHEQCHRLGRIVHARLKHRLVPHVNAPLDQPLDPNPRVLGDLMRRVEVGVQHHIFAEPPALFDHLGERIHPLVVGDELLRHDRRPLGGEPHAAHVGQ